MELGEGLELTGPRYLMHWLCRLSSSIAQDLFPCHLQHSAWIIQIGLKSQSWSCARITY
ncbi:hypothetical protein RchiOBHm_Chr5g0053591 [Rosa chinensis]|uniref:Uncharacterized protein n=1 Tax=Rosa chinensis TaxID=74649 RepID=A0A2P6QFZ4_ROSCH|nr:hypothetical protein RchiOBHm_Chr5g0053591 [Rosa chinensis]